MSAETRVPKGRGVRRRWRGRMVLPNGHPRSHSPGGHGQATAGWTCNDTLAMAEPTKHVQGRFKVGAPTKRWMRHGIVCNATTGEQIQ